MERPKPPTDDELDEPGPTDPGPVVVPPDPLLDEPDDFDEPVAGSVEGRGLSDMLRKAMVAGLGAVFMTEEGIRTYVKDLKLPKELMGFVVGQAERSKDELFRVVGQELRHFFESAALRRELTRLLSEVTIELKAEIRLKPSGEGGLPEPEVKVHSATARRQARKRKNKKKR